MAVDCSCSNEAQCCFSGRVFAVRLVLTGPAPCELVDAKICLTFRNFVKLPSGSMFCATQDLELVRPEVTHHLLIRLSTLLVFQLFYRALKL